MREQIGTEVLKHYLHLYETFEEHPEFTEEFLALDKRLADSLRTLVEEVLRHRLRAPRPR